MLWLLKVLAVFHFSQALTAPEDLKPHWCRLLLTEDGAPLAEEALQIFHFSRDYRISTRFNSDVRKSIHKAFAKVDYYNGEDLSFEDMTLDHIIPRHLGGPDHLFNYVPTSERNNIDKGARFTLYDFVTLYHVFDYFAPKAISQLRSLDMFRIYRDALDIGRQTKTKKVKTSDSQPKKASQSTSSKPEKTEEVTPSPVKVVKPKNKINFVDVDPTALGLLSEIIVKNTAHPTYWELEPDFQLSLEQTRLLEDMTYQTSIESHAGEDRLDTTGRLVEIDDFDPKKTVVAVHPYIIISVSESEENSLESVQSKLQELLRSRRISKEEYNKWISYEPEF